MAASSLVRFLLEGISPQAIQHTQQGVNTDPEHACRGTGIALARHIPARRACPDYVIFNISTLALRR